MRAARRDAHRPSLAAGASSCTPCGTGSYYSSSGAYALLILVREISLMCDREYCVVRRHVSVGIRLCACACARTRMFTDVLEHALDPVKEAYVIDPAWSWPSLLQSSCRSLVILSRYPSTKPL